MRSRNGDKLQAKLGQRVASLRAEKSVTQEQLAEKTGLDRMTIALIETGKRWPQAATLDRLTKGLGVGVGDVFKGL